MISHRSASIVIIILVFAASTVSVARLKAAPTIQPNATCNGPGPCKSFTNNGSGSGMAATSVGGNGSTSATKFNSTSATNFKAGILGLDGSTSGTFDAGVEGTSKFGDGVLGITTSGGTVAAAGVAGVLGAPSGIALFGEGAVFGDSANGDGVLGYSANADGMVAASTNKTGLIGITFNNSATTKQSEDGVFGSDLSSGGGALNVGVLGESASGIGVQGSSGFIGVNAVGGVFLDGNAYPALSIVEGSHTVNGDMIDACVTANPCSRMKAVLVIDGFGDIGSFGAGDFGTTGHAGLAVSLVNAPNGPDVDITGQYQKAGNCVAGCAPPTQKTAGRGVQSYSAQSTAPTIEDFGEAQLVNGQASVALGTDFANVINQSGNYLVFAMPEGECNGLYIAGKSSQGFTVRELRGGHSTIAFEYRIVAKPYGDKSARLPMVTEPRLDDRTFGHLIGHKS